MTIKNVVFDMGQVLLRFDGMMLSSAFTNDEGDARLLNAALFAHPSWSLLGAGAIDEGTMERVAAARLPERLHPNLHRALAEWDLHQPAITGTNRLAERIHAAGLGVYLLSNAGLRFERAHARIPCWDIMDGWVVSAYEGLMKPDPRIYQLLCDRYGLKPAECLFVDDNRDNVAGAMVAGMEAHLFVGADALGHELMQRGTEV